MEQQQISPKKQKALEKVKRANAELAKVVREEKEQLLSLMEQAGYEIKRGARTAVKGRNQKTFFNFRPKE